tara:strand:- start:191 stop:874 length:684 start_codon:yes stop_codon:yes gene_type:complete
VYVAILGAAIYFFWSTFDLKDLTSYDLIKENKEAILAYKENNIFFLTVIFLTISIVLNILLTPMFLPTVIIGFIFGKWLGTLILVFGNTIGATFLYALTKNFFGDFIEEKFSKKFQKFIIFFNKNETIYFMCFRFMGGGGTPFPIQNVLPVLFNMSIKNYIIATFIGIIPVSFVTVALGSGIENIIDQNEELSFSSVFFSPEIYLPICGFFLLMIFAYIIKKIFFKN